MFTCFDGRQYIWTGDNKTYDNMFMCLNGMQYYVLTIKYDIIYSHIFGRMAIICLYGKTNGNMCRLHRRLYEWHTSKWSCQDGRQYVSMDDNKKNSHMLICLHEKAIPW